MKLIPRDFFLDDIVDSFFTPRESNFLKCDIYEKDNMYTLEMDAPGIKKDDLDIDVEDGYLTIALSQNEEKNDENKNYIRKERCSREYKRSFYIGEVDDENIKASLINGTLKIEVPKTEKIESKKRIEIE